MAAQKNTVNKSTKANTEPGQYSMCTPKEAGISGTDSRIAHVTASYVTTDGVLATQ